MNATLTLIAYGLLINAGFFMTFFWGRVAVRRIRSIRLRDSLDDRQSILATCLTTCSLGISIACLVRMYRELAWGEISPSSTHVSSYLLLLGLFIVAFSKIGFVWAVHCDFRSFAWRAFMILSLVWILIAVVWADM